MQLKTFSQQETRPKALSHSAKAFHNIDIAYVGGNFIDETAVELYKTYNYNIELLTDISELYAFVQQSGIKGLPGVILLEIDSLNNAEDSISGIKNNPLTGGLVLILLSKNKNAKVQYGHLLNKANDIYSYPFPIEKMAERINFLIRFKLLKPTEGFHFQQHLQEYKPPVLSRAFSFTVALATIIILSPLLFLTALLIRLESKGPVIYKSKRAGTGYKIFDFYKFRSMVVDADKKLEALSKTNNQYNGNGTPNGQAFVKILNDPRVTKMGNFIRKTSIDELPQLFNVLKGDMMLVGNRPLPLYEAEMLTSDQFAMRFLGPAGITGLWQVSKRGKAEMSDSERKELDNHYAKYSSFWMDIKIMLKTIPALLQKENV